MAHDAVFGIKTHGTVCVQGAVVGEVVVCAYLNKVALDSACIIDIVCINDGSVFGDEVAMVVKLACQLHVNISC